MKHQSAATVIPSGRHALNSSGAGEIITAFKNTEDFKNFFQKYPLPNLDDLIMKLAAPAGKKNFLVFKNNKYINVLTENIAFFYVKYDSSIIVDFDRNEYFVNHSLEQSKTFYQRNSFSD